MNKKIIGTLLFAALLLGLTSGRAWADYSWGAGTLQTVTNAGATTTTSIAWGGGYGDTDGGCTGDALGNLSCDGTVISFPNATPTFSGFALEAPDRFIFDSPTDTIYLYGDVSQGAVRGPGFYVNHSTGNGFYSYNSGAGVSFYANLYGSGRGMSITHYGSGNGVNLATAGTGRALNIENTGTGYPLYISNQNAGISTAYLNSAASSTEFILLMDSNSTVGGDILEARAQIDGIERKVWLVDQSGHAGFGPDIVLGDLATDTVYASGTITATGGFKTSTTGDVMEIYDTGDWSPTATATLATCTNTVRVGKYIRIGNMVHADFRVTTTGCTGSGNFSITGLPFTSTTTTNYMAGCTIGYFHNFALAAGYVPTALIGANSTSIDLYQFNPGGSASSQVGVDTDGFTISGTCDYTTDTD